MKKTSKKNTNGRSTETSTDKHLRAVCTCCSVTTKLQEVIDGRPELEYAEHPECSDEFVLANAVHNWLLNSGIRTSEFIRYLVGNDEHLFQLMLQQRDAEEESK